MELWTGFTLGLLGSFHCIGMCGPIALSIPGENRSNSSMFFRGILYNSGRIFTYAFLGFGLGILGMGATIAGYQNLLSISLGALIVLFALFPHIKFPKKPGKLYDRFQKMISSSIATLFKDRSVSSAFLIGLLNGLLPCGFVVTALAVALVTDTALHSSIYMALFGLGTLPVMLMMNMAPGFISPKWRSKLRPFSTYFAVIIGLLLIWRGVMVGNGMIGH
ncbi:sulfite exporter TauE/SafE family protein [Gracilimonas halophila]|uniref:Sulfite exporter TauE/SafE family protein n=1 Tax=Gracilimonas halophila TaxID=1834464 RepID=A0ABW5JJM4_9BACT